MYFVRPPNEKFLQAVLDYSSTVQKFCSIAIIGLTTNKQWILGFRLNKVWTLRQKGQKILGTGMSYQIVHLQQRAVQTHLWHGPQHPLSRTLHSHRATAATNTQTKTNKSLFQPTDPTQKQQACSLWWGITHLCQEF